MPQSASGRRRKAGAHPRRKVTHVSIALRRRTAAAVCSLSSPSALPLATAAPPTPA
jgi:hypothetical protein